MLLPLRFLRPWPFRSQRYVFVVSLALSLFLGLLLRKLPGVDKR